MKFTKHILASAVLLATSSFAIAATDTTNIEINVTKDAYVNLLGSVLTTNATAILSEVQVNGATTSLGTLGAEANTGGGCLMTFTSANGYKLLHDSVPGLYLHDAGTYTVVHNTAAYSTNCNQTASDLSVTFPAIATLPVRAGTYSDTLTVTVVTQ